MTWEPIRLHPDNPHYFLFRGEPAVLITSGEHYGAVLNGDFDYVAYLDEIQRCGFNQTRTFSGTYREVPGSFDIPNNTLAPDPKRYVSPWMRSETPGSADGGNKFDLTRWNDAYFARLKDFVTEASKRGIVVEYVFFCVFYEDVLWEMNPMNAKNNINGIGDVAKEDAYQLSQTALLNVQLAFVRKAVRELKDFDNVYFEGMNEPDCKDIPMDWQHRITGEIAASEGALPKRHLIAQGIGNGAPVIDDPNPAVGVFNFHYAWPPNAVAKHYHLNRALAFDESGFRGIHDAPYRTEAWEYFLAGGSVYSQLDYSYSTDHPAGTKEITEGTPGGGGRELRRQLGILKDFLYRFDFVRMGPDRSVIASELPEKTSAYALAEAGKAYAIYLRGDNLPAAVSLSLPTGQYAAEWLDPLTGGIVLEQAVDHAGGAATLALPAGLAEVALSVHRR
jgi:hypothetical protein